MKKLLAPLEDILVQLVTALGEAAVRVLVAEAVSLLEIAMEKLKQLVREMQAAAPAPATESALH